YVSFGQIDPPERDAKGNTRTFSIASAPEEADVMITTRMRDSAFKSCLKTMKFGATVTMEGPFGDLVLPGDANRPAVLLAGGIGVTPFRSVVLPAILTNRWTRPSTRADATTRPRRAPLTIGPVSSFVRRLPAT